MSAVVWVIATFGCADDGMACERVAPPAVQFASRAACVAAANAMLADGVVIDYPVMTVSCEREGVTMVKAGQTRVAG